MNTQKASGEQKRFVFLLALIFCSGGCIVLQGYYTLCSKQEDKATEKGGS